MYRLQIVFVSDAEHGEFRVQSRDTTLFSSRCPWLVLERASYIAEKCNAPLLLTDEAAMAIARVGKDAA